MSRITPIYVAVVDDDESLCRSLGRLLRAAGIQPITYASAEAFLAEGGHTPIVFITAHDDPEARAEAEALGCTDYFRKTDFGAEVLEAHLIERSVEGHQHKSN